MALVVVTICIVALGACGSATLPSVPQRAAAPLISPECDHPQGLAGTAVSNPGFPVGLSGLILASDWIVVADIGDIRPSPHQDGAPNTTDVSEIVLADVGMIFESGLAHDGAGAPTSFHLGTGVRTGEGDTIKVTNGGFPDLKTGDRGLFFLQERESGPYAWAATATAANGVYVFVGDAYRCAIDWDNDPVRREVESYAPMDVAAWLTAEVATLREDGTVSGPIPRCTDVGHCRVFKRYFEGGQLHEVELTPEEYQRYGLHPVG